MCHQLRAFQKTHNATHQRLVERIAARDENALSDLYGQTHSLALSIAQRILADREAAEEAVQDAYLQIWSRADSFDPRRGSPLAWIITIVRARSLDRLRKLSRARREDPWEEGWETACRDSRPTSRGLEMRWLVRSALSQLKSEQRALIEQAYFGGMSHRELASRLQMPLGTIKTRIRSAMRSLRECLRCHDLAGLLD